MTDEVKKSRRGVYYDLEVSPYEYLSPYGDIFKFRSRKRLELYTRDIETEIRRVEKLMHRHDLSSLLPDEILQLLYKAVYRAFYRKIEG